MEDKKEPSQAAGTTREVEKLLLNGEITLNQAREQLGLTRISESKANMFLMKLDKVSS